MANQPTNQPPGPLSAAAAWRQGQKSLGQVYKALQKAWDALEYAWEKLEEHEQWFERATNEMDREELKAWLRKRRPTSELRLRRKPELPRNPVLPSSVYYDLCHGSSIEYVSAGTESVYLTTGAGKTEAFVAVLWREYFTRFLERAARTSPPTPDSQP